MKFTFALSAALSCANLAYASSDPFQLLSVGVDTGFHFNNVFVQDDILYLGKNNNPQNALITDDLYLQYIDKFVGINDKGFLTIADTKESARSNFTVYGGNLVLDDKNFYAVPDGGKFALGTTPGSGAVGVVICAKELCSNDAIMGFPPREYIPPPRK